MSYLLVENSGEAEVMSLTLMGASSKRDASDKIGVFGTGFKNAISILLRHDVGVELFFGENRIACSKRPVVFRDKTFQQIVFTIDGKDYETGFTTDMGLRWDMAGALREIFSNAIDETGCVSAEWNEALSGRSGRTRVFVQMTKEVADFSKNIGLQFLKMRDTQPIHKFTGGDIWAKHDSNGTRFYRRGVLVFESDKPSCFDYNFDEITISEERKANEFEAMWAFGHAVDSFPLDAKSKLIPFLSRDGFEAHCDHIGQLASPDWKTLYEGKVVCDAAILDGLASSYIPKHKAVRTTAKWESALGNAGVTTSAAYLTGVHKEGGNVVTPTAFEETALSWAVGFIQRAGYILEREQIVVFVSGDAGKYGEWDKKAGKILISRVCIEKGRHFLISTLIEEIFHRDSGFSDFTRQFQDFIFDKFVGLVQRQQNEYL